jgi:putative chitinase
MPRAVDVVRRIAPRARPSYVAAFEQGDALLFAHGITTRARLAHFLAQVLHETGGLEIEWENMSYSAPRLLEVFGTGCHSAGITPGEAQALAHRPEAIAERVYGLGNPRKARELGNTQPGDGFRYRGGGLMQTTGRANYRRMGEKCGVDFEGEPHLVLSAEHALKPALCEWTEGRLNAFADCDDILSISRAINLGNPHAPRTPNGMEKRVAWYARLHSLIDRVEFAATAGELAPQAIPVPPRPAEADVAEQSVAAIIANRILRFGDRGSDVQAIQRALARLGYGLSGTGNYGANTRTAVADFQASHGLEVDGEVGPETARVIDAALASASETPKPADGAAPPPRPPEPPQPPAPLMTESPAVASVSGTLAASVGDRILRMGDAGDLVRAIQLALAKLGYDLKGSGNYGPNTQSAVADFQARHGLEVDGEVGSETAKAIDAVLASAGAAGKPAHSAEAPRTVVPMTPAMQPSTRGPRAIQARGSAW